VNTPSIIGKNDNFISISSALEVDLTGQVCSDSIGRQFFSGTGDQVNFIRGATLSKGGLSITIFSRKMAQDHWATIDYRQNISLIGVVQNRGNKEIIAIGTYAKMDEKWAEVAFVVREDYQGHGIAGYLIKELEKIAAANGFAGFFATTLPENKAMINLCKKCYPDIKMDANADEVEIWMKF
jgi:GNAT superfamily N-acetyltransferase